LSAVRRGGRKAWAIARRRGRDGRRRKGLSATVPNESPPSRWEGCPRHQAPRTSRSLPERSRRRCRIAAHDRRGRLHGSGVNPCETVRQPSRRAQSVAFRL